MQIKPLMLAAIWVSFIVALVFAFQDQYPKAIFFIFNSIFLRLDIYASRYDQN